MRTLSTLLVSSAVVATLLSGASMAMRATAAPEAPAPSQTWSNPPERAFPAARSEAPEPARPIPQPPAEAAQVPDRQAAAVTPVAARETPRRAMTRAEAPKRAEAARPLRRMAQASLRPRPPAPRGGSSAVPAPSARPVNPISDFLRGVGLLDDDHG